MAVLGLRAVRARHSILSPYALHNSPEIVSVAETLLVIYSGLRS